MNRSRPKHKRNGPCKTCIVLGSGGHTSEMIALARHMIHERYSPRLYIIANTDDLSEVKARKIEQDRSAMEGKDYFVHRIPRLREVGQPLQTVPFSVIKSLLGSLYILSNMPDLVLCNGPGSCIAVCMIAYLPRIFGIKHIHIVYVESFARVKTLSLTGKLLYNVVDSFLVQWPDLVAKYPRSVYNGIVV